MTALAVPRGTSARAPRPVAVLDDILLELIDVGDNVRDDVGDLTELKASIALLDLIEPIKVTAQSSGRYLLIVGQRRVAASREIGRLRIRAIVEPPSDVDEKGARRSIEQLSENLIRKDLNPIEEAVALREVLDAQPGLTQEALADMLAMSRPWVSNTLRLLTVDPLVQSRVRSGEISASHAKVIAALPPKQQRELAARVVDHKLSAHDLEREIKWKQDAAAQEEAKARKTERTIPRVTAALEKAETPKAAAVLVHGPWDVDVDAVVRAVKAAGWKAAKNQYAYGSRPKACDCTAVKVEIYGRSPSVQPTCTNDKHQAKGRDVDHEAFLAAERLRDAQLEQLRAAIRRSLSFNRPGGLVLRLLDWTLEHWHHQETWEVHVAHSDDELLDSIAAHVAQVHPTRDLDLEALIAELDAAVGSAHKTRRKVPAVVHEPAPDAS